MNSNPGLAEFAHYMTKVMGFHQFIRETGEIYWQVNIPRTMYVIQVRSGLSIDDVPLSTSDTGIRIYVCDSITGAAAYPPVRVRRTPHALRNIREKVGRLWKHINANKNNKGVKLAVK